MITYFNLLCSVHVEHFSRRFKLIANNMWFVVLFSIACISWGGSWQHVRIGPPLLDLTDFAVTMHGQLLQGRYRAPSPDDDKPEGMQHVEQAMAAAVAENGLALDVETATNGDCGVDAILRNLARLRLANPRALQLLNILQTRGRDAACAAMRLMLLIWIRDHAAFEVIPGVSIAAWVAMEGYVSVAAYVAAMRVPRTWIDTPMVMAASAVFNIQFVCFVGRGEPHLVAAPEIAASSSDVPVGFLANSNNVHHYACHPGVEAGGCDSADGLDAAGDELMMSMVGASAFSASVGDPESEPAEEQGTRTPAANLSVHNSNLFALCSCLNKWEDAFAAPSPEILGLLCEVEAGSPGDAVTSCFEVLQWRDAIKLLQWELLEFSSGLNREHVYQVARRHHEQPRRGRHRQYVKSRKIVAKLVLEHVVAMLSKPCNRNKAAHACLDPFRSQPTAVLRWRKLWYAMPKQAKEARLCKLFADEFQAHTAACLGHPTGFHMKFRIFGTPVCRNALIAITGIHADTLQKARNAATGGSLPPWPPHGLWVSRRPIAYLLARAWLLTYAQSHGDTSPLCDSLFLPAGRKQYYYSVYYRDAIVREMPSAHIASLGYFLTMWRTELPWIQLRSPTGPFTHCGLCDFLKMMIGSTHDPGMRHMVLMRLGEHYDFQAAQRLAMNNIFADSTRNPSEVLAVAWDKMDQAKNIIPRVKALANTQFMKGGARIVVSLVGVLIPGVSHRPWFYTVFEDQQQGSDMICSLMIDVLLEAVGVLGQLPRR